MPIGTCVKGTSGITLPPFTGVIFALVEQSGEVSERLKEHAWKVCIRQRIEGSNPSLSAKLYQAPQCTGLFCASRNRDSNPRYSIIRFDHRMECGGTERERRSSLSPPNYIKPRNARGFFAPHEIVIRTLDIQSSGLTTALISTRLASQLLKTLDAGCQHPFLACSGQVNRLELTDRRQTTDDN